MFTINKHLMGIVEQNVHVLLFAVVILQQVDIIKTLPMKSSCNFTTVQDCSDCDRPGFYGINCEIPCNCHTKIAMCDKSKGTCQNGCQQWFTVNPNLKHDNCNASIPAPLEPFGLYIRSRSTTNVSMKITMNTAIPTYLDKFYYYNLTCTKIQSNEVITNFKISHNSSNMDQIVWVPNLEVFTRYRIYITAIREQNGIKEQSSLYNLPTFMTHCFEPSAPLLSYQLWPEHSVYISWKLSDIYSGCKNANISKITLYRIATTETIKKLNDEDSDNNYNNSNNAGLANRPFSGSSAPLLPSQISDQHFSYILALDSNNKVVTHLKAGTYKFWIRVNNNDDQAAADSPIITVTVPSYLSFPRTTAEKNIIITTIIVLGIMLVISTFVIIFLVIYICKKGCFQKTNVINKSINQLPIDDDFSDDNVFNEDSNICEESQYIIPPSSRRSTNSRSSNNNNNESNYTSLKLTEKSNSINDTTLVQDQQYYAEVPLTEMVGTGNKVKNNNGVQCGINNDSISGIYINVPQQNTQIGTRNNNNSKGCHKLQKTNPTLQKPALPKKPKLFYNGRK